MSDNPHNPPDSGGFLKTTAVCAALVLAVAIVYGRTINYEFINLDDDACVSGNDRLMEGLTWRSLGWAFTNTRVGNSDPLTWISHLIDWHIFGDNAGGHHLTNVLLHALATVLLFLVLRQMTGRFWPSAIAAALFALHPLRVESVAWVTERKDVLSGVFFMLTLAAYTSYARHRFSIWRYSLVIVLFVMGLLSKPMLVTLPCVLLLLDYWPLGRFGSVEENDVLLENIKPRPPGAFSLDAGVRMVVEKIPLFVITAACCVVAVYAQKVPDYQYGPPLWRLNNAVISYAEYLSRFFYPVDLAPLAPRTDFNIPLGSVIVSAAILLAVTAATLVFWRKRPYLIVGWLWFLGMLFPTIGLVPFGTQAMADRFTYLPQIGLCIAVVWGVDELIRRWPHRRWICGVSAAAVIITLTACSWRQTSYWRNSETLWNRTIECTSNNYMAHYAWGNALAKQGKIEDAMIQYRKALEIKPDYADAYFNLGVAAFSLGRWNEAAEYYLKALDINPRHANAANNLANLYLNMEDLQKAIAVSRHLLEEIDPGYLEAHINIGTALLRLERFEEAANEYRQALSGGVEYPVARYNLAIALYYLGRYEEAEENYRKAVQVKPDILNDRMDLGELLDKKKKE